MTLELTLLGTGSPSPLPYRGGSSYLLRYDDDYILVDCGPACVRRILEKGVPITKINTHLLTHLHYDHCVDYSYLILTRWDQGAGKIPELQVYGPKPIQRMTQQLFGRDGVWQPDLSARTEHPGSHYMYEARGGVLPRKWPDPQVTEVGPGSTIQNKHWRVTVAEVAHCQPQLICLAYRMEIAGKTIIFGGDTGYTPKLVQLAKGADVLIHMCHLVNGVVTDPRIVDCCGGHLDAARTAQEAGVKTLVLTHITEQVERPGMRERVIHEVCGVFKGGVIFAQDLLNVPLEPVSAESLR